MISEENKMPEQFWLALLLYLDVPIGGALHVTDL